MAFNNRPYPQAAPGRGYPPHQAPGGGPPRRAPVGARGPPAGPRADLARADTGAVRHDLYVKLVVGSDPDHKSRALTLEVLQYVHSRLPTFRRMGLDVRVNKIRSQDLQNPRLVDAMRKRGITRLPALTTPNNVYIGFNEIQDIYERNAQEFSAVGRRGERSVEGAAPDDDLHQFYRDEMTFERAEEDAEEEGLGQDEDLMDSYRHMMERREQAGTGRRKPAAPSRGPATPERRAAPPRSPPAARPDNVGSARPPARGARPVDPEDAEIQDTIDRLARDIDDNFRSQAFTAGGGDSYADDEGGGGDYQDDLMEAAYWGNAASSENF